MKTVGTKTLGTALGRKLKVLRTQRGWSQEDVARRLNISIPACSKIESAATDMSLSRLEQLANVFEMTIAELLENEDPEQKQQYVSDLEIATKKLQERDAEVLDLQKKVIDLYEELRQIKK